MGVGHLWTQASSIPCKLICHTEPIMKRPHPLLILAIAGVGLVAWLVGCAARPEPVEVAPAIQAPSPPLPLPAANAPAEVARQARTPPPPSNATTARAYRRDAARHLYNQNGHRVYQGKLPPLLHAIGVLQVEVDSLGRVTGISWMRAPKHAPDVIAEIERSVRAAAPLYVWFLEIRLIVDGLWSLWAKAGAVGNTQCFPRQVSRFAAGKLSTNPQSPSWFRCTSSSPLWAIKPVGKQGAVH